MNDFEPDRDDELRRRLHDIPSASARLDADAIIAGAKKRRRPKTIALSSAATIAGVLIVAPFVVPGLSPLQGGDSASVSSDAGAAPESAPQPAEQPATDGGADDDAQSAGDGATGAAGSDAPAEGSGDAATGTPDGPAYPLEQPAAWCGLERAGDAGLALTMLEQPAASGPGAGFARVRLTNTGDASVGVVARSVIWFEVEETITGSSGTMFGGESEALALEPGESAELTQPTAVLPPGVCGDGTASADVPMAIVGVDGAEPVGVVGSPFE